MQHPAAAPLRADTSRVNGRSAIQKPTLVPELLILKRGTNLANKLRLFRRNAKKNNDNRVYGPMIICVAGRAACRYEKGTWSGCVNQLSTRVDNLKANSDPTCEKTRLITKRCKPETNTKKSTKGGERSNKKSGKQ
ncbi:hypothetical protein HZH66_012277 [Vespula vulgaris]|uniref:Pleiotrophin/Midkine C-terminal domain-containing protein n=1 Tax=Vespula vulgaris TaxID=7454 RepID=A0A834JAZ6_VESVU|nr:hypothetical protein HZH66_012277 [Vespula vulgaris]